MPYAVNIICLSTDELDRLNLRERTGVYFIRNKINDHIYVGSASRSFRRRWLVHQRSLDLKKNLSRHLQNAWIKYGRGSFEFGVVEDCEPESCVVREQFWINFLKPEYNVCRIATSRRGVRASDETIAKLKLNKPNSGSFVKGHTFSRAILAKMRMAKLGKKTSDETKMKLSAASKGRKYSPEIIERMTIAQRKWRLEKKERATCE